MAVNKNALTAVSPVLIQHWRKIAGLSVYQAARKAGIDHLTIYNWEAGRTKPSPSLLGKFAKAVGKEINDFFPVRADSVRDKATAVIDDYFSDGNYDKDRKASRAIDILKIPIPAPEEDGETALALPPDFWKKPSILPFYSDNCIEFWEFDGDEIFIRGPARCGKSTLIFEWAIAQMFAYDGIQIIVARAFSVDLDAVRQNIRDICKYRFSDPLSPIKVIGGSKFDTVCIGNSRMVLKGIDRSEGQLGSGYDIGIFSQAEQIRKESIDTISSRVTPASQNWVVDGVAKSLIIYDLNPNRLDNWAEDVIKKGTPTINFTFEDHPGYFTEDGQETQLYQSVRARLEKMSGVQRKRLLEGIAANPEGNIFELEDCHLLDKLPDDFDTANSYFRAFDFGLKAPNVSLWVSEHRQTGDLIVYQEYRRTGEDTISFGNSVNDHTKQKILATVQDNDENLQMMLRDHCGIRTHLAKKGPNSVKSSIGLIQDRLNRAKRGEDGGLYFYNNPVFRDPKLIADSKPLTIIDEGELYSWATNGDKPVDDYNHGFDALGYLLDYLESRQASVGFGGGAVRRQKRV